MLPKKALIGGLVCVIGSIVGYFARPAIEPLGPNAAMPDASAPKGVVTTDGVVRVSKIEVVDPTSGKLMMILTSENGIPVIIVNDQGTARKVDIARFVRRFG